MEGDQAFYDSVHKDTPKVEFPDNFPQRTQKEGNDNMAENSRVGDLDALFKEKLGENDTAPAAPAEAQKKQPKPATGECWDVSKMKLGPGDGPRRVFTYHDPRTKKQHFSIYEDAARQAGNGVCESSWVWYLDGEYVRPLNTDEIRLNLP